MSRKLLASIVLNVAAIVVPVGFLYARYGVDTPVAWGGQEATRQMLSIASAMVVGFLCALGAGTVLKSSRESAESLLKMVFDALKASPPANRSQRART
jgi:hypothetical protein